MKQLTTLLLVFATSLLMAQNHSLQFDGEDDFVKITSRPEFTPNQFTIEAWVKADESGTSPVFSKGNSYDMSFNWFNDRLRLAVYQSYEYPYSIIFRGVETDNAALTIGEWQHLAATFDLNSQEIKLYINGIEAETHPVYESTTIGSIYNGNKPVRIGSMEYGNNSFYFNGNIDEARFWNVVRTQAEIQANMNTELTGTESGLVSYYKMDIPDTSCDVIDCSSSENHGDREGIYYPNNLPQYSTETAPIADVDCATMSDVCQPIFSECLYDEIVLSTQSEVDSFSYCYEITGNLTIGGQGSDITNLDALNTINIIEGNLSISSEVLTDISGLSGVSVRGDVNISSTALNNLDGLSNIYFDDNLTIENNPLLTSISTFQSSSFDNIYIIGNDNLQNLNGFIGTLRIRYNLIIEDNK